MSIGNGIPYMGYESVLGIAKETTYGTFVTATSFVEFNSENFKFMREEIKLEAINGTRDYTKRMIGKETVEGGFEAPLNVASDVIVNVIKQAMGGSVTSTQISVGAYKHVLAVGNMENNGATTTAEMKGLSAFIRKGGTHLWGVSGLRVNTLTIKGEIGQPLVMACEMIGQKMSLTSSLPTVSYTDVLPINFTGVAISSGATIDAALTEQYYTSFEFTLNNNLDGEQGQLGSRNISILPPVRRECKLKLAQRFDTSTAYAESLANTASAISIIMSADTAIVDATTYSMAIKLPLVYFNGPPLPEIGEAGVLSLDLDGTCMRHGTLGYPVSIEICNATAAYA